MDPKSYKYFLLDETCFSAAKYKKYIIKVNNINDKGRNTLNHKIQLHFKMKVFNISINQCIRPSWCRFPSPPPKLHYTSHIFVFTRINRFKSQLFFCSSGIFSQIPLSRLLTGFCLKSLENGLWWTPKWTGFFKLWTCSSNRLISPQLMLSL